MNICHFLSPVYGFQCSWPRASSGFWYAVVLYPAADTSEERTVSVLETDSFKPEEEGSIILRNVHVNVQHCTLSQPRKLQSKQSPHWTPEKLLYFLTSAACLSSNFDGFRIRLFCWLRPVSRVYIPYFCFCLVYIGKIEEIFLRRYRSCFLVSNTT